MTVPTHFAHASLAALLTCHLLGAAPAVAAGVPLSVRGDRLFIPVEVNGRKIGALLDSAAESSLMDPAFARQLALPLAGGAIARGSGGEAQAQFAHVSVRAASVELQDVTVAVLDLSDVSRRLVGSQVVFILGREFFDAARLRIDIEGGSIEVLSRRSPVAGTALTLTQHAGIEALPARTEGIAAAADFDLGNGSNVMIGKAFAERNGLLTPARIVARRRGGGIGGGMEREVVRLATLELAGTTFRDVEADVDPLGNAGDLNLGVRILRHFIIVTDFAQQRVWLEPRAQ